MNSILTCQNSGSDKVPNFGTKLTAYVMLMNDSEFIAAV